MTQRPQIASALLDNLGYALPDGEPEVLDSTLSALELRPDQLLKLGHGRDALVIAIEVQTRPPSWDKWHDWAAYQVLAAREDRCQALVLVIALRADTARRCRNRSPFITGPGCQTSVAVIGPADLADGPHAGLDSPIWALLAVACNTLDIDTPTDRTRALDAIAQADDNEIDRWSKLLLAMASEQAVVALEKLMATQYRETIIDRAVAEGRAEGRSEGRAEGRAEGRSEGRQQGASLSLLAVLAARGIEVPAGVRDAVQQCPDGDQLSTWVERAATADTLNDVFGERLSDWL